LQGGKASRRFLYIADEEHPVDVDGHSWTVAERVTAGGIEEGERLSPRSTLAPWAKTRNLLGLRRVV
jgi:hypothetical protein